VAHLQVDQQWRPLLRLNPRPSPLFINAPIYRNGAVLFIKYCCVVLIASNSVNDAKLRRNNFEISVHFKNAKLDQAKLVRLFDS
jgi:hypothetical protein